MIAKLTGKIDTLKPTELILDVSGIGYQVHIPFSAYEKLQGLSEAVLHIFTLHKEDQLKLFGFMSEDEKELFSILLNISGVGPSIALSILSGLTVDRLIEAVKQESTASLTKIPGIGKAKAEKLIFELKRKIKKIESFSLTPGSAPSATNEAVEALVSLGFEEARASKAVEEVRAENGDPSIEDIIRKSLHKLSG